MATRRSTLAMAQTNHAIDVLKGLMPDFEFEVMTFTTSGDRFLQKGLHGFGGKGAFTKELEVALLEGRADITVHSLKDLPTKQPDGLGIISVLPREVPFDAFVSNKYNTLKDVPEGGRIGTGSIRRSVQLLDLRPDIEIVPIRGNVQTRLKKIEELDLDGVILAVAGLKRLGLDGLIKEVLRPSDFIPAAAQGAIAIEARLNWDVGDVIARMATDRVTQRMVNIERGILDALGGGCHAPVGVYCEGYDKNVRVWVAWSESGSGKLKRFSHSFDKELTDQEIINKVVEGLK